MRSVQHGRSRSSIRTTRSRPSMSMRRPELRECINRTYAPFGGFFGRISDDVFAWLRLYAGGGYIFHRFPDDLGRGTTEWGVELVSSTTYLDGRVRPVAYADFQCNEMWNWSVGQSLMAGVRFENARIGNRQLQLLGEFYAGPVSRRAVLSSTCELVWNRAASLLLTAWR